MRNLMCSRLLSSLIALAAITTGCDDDDPANPNPARPDAGDAGLADAGADVASEVMPGPAPDAGMIAVNRPERRDFTPAALAQLRLKSGFRIQVFATAMMNARWLAIGPDGSAYVTTPMTSQVHRLADGNGDGDVDDAGERTVVANAMTTPDLRGVHGIAFHEGRVYLGSIKNVVRGTVGPGGTFTDLTTIVRDLPDGGQHPNRTLAIGPDGKLYVSVGSDCNACNETNSEHATMLRVNLDGTMTDNPMNPQHPMLAHNPMSMISPRVWASGLRNTLGFDWHPVSGQLWGIDQGSDGLGETLPPEEINALTGGRSYGWPFCWGNRQVDPVMDNPSMMLRKEMYCPMTEPASAGLEAHSSPLAFLFYRGTHLPAEYRNDAFLVLRGSWDRTTPVGYKLVRVHFENGMPAAVPGGTNVAEDIVSGFLIDGGKAHFGRIAGLAVDATGALLLGDDTNGMIYRITHVGGAGDGGVDGGGADGGADALTGDAGAPDAGAGG